MINKLNELANLIKKEAIQRLVDIKLDCEANIKNVGTQVKEGKKYFKIDKGHSAFIMIDFEGNIFGVKGYGVINKKKCYGTLDTIHEYYWGEYNPVKKEVKQLCKNLI